MAQKSHILGFGCTPLLEKVSCIHQIVAVLGLPKNVCCGGKSMANKDTKPTKDTLSLLWVILRLIRIMGGT